MSIEEEFKERFDREYSGAIRDYYPKAMQELKSDNYTELELRIYEDGATRFVTDPTYSFEEYEIYLIEAITDKTLEEWFLVELHYLDFDSPEEEEFFHDNIFNATVDFLTKTLSGTEELKKFGTPCFNLWKGKK